MKVIAANEFTWIKCTRMLKVHQFSKGVVKWVYRIENKLLCLVSQYCYCYVLLDYAFLKIKVLLIMKKYQWKKYSVKGYCDSKFWQILEFWLSDNLKNSFTWI